MVVDSIKLTFTNEDEYNSVLILLDKLFPGHNIQANMIKDRGGYIYWVVVLEEIMTTNEAIDLLNKC